MAKAKMDLSAFVGKLLESEIKGQPPSVGLPWRTKG